MMPFDALRNKEFDLRERFPSDFIGKETWFAVLETLPAQLPVFPDRRSRPQRPCVFVSYKSQDRSLAKRIAWLVNEQGFDFWMDVFDPRLQFANANHRLTPAQKSVLIASIIELGLLNSTHVLAVITNRSYKSQWIPYEFGRAKVKTLLSDQASSWIHPLQKPKLAEYLELCPKHSGEKQINDYLIAERSKWHSTHSPLGQPANPWTFGPTFPLP